MIMKFARFVFWTTFVIVIANAIMSVGFAPVGFFMLAVAAVYFSVPQKAKKGKKRANFASNAKRTGAKMREAEKNVSRETIG